VSTSFHGRDIFSPAAAHVAGGLAPSALGPRVPPAELHPLPVPPVTRDGDAVTASVLYIDRFGSLILAAGRDDLPATLAYGTPLEVAWTDRDGAPRTVRAAFAETFGSVAEGEPLIWVDSSGRLGLAVNRGSAAARFGLAPDAVLTIRPAPEE
jgi:S-adenosylmethionine hydrolase